MPSSHHRIARLAVAGAAAVVGAGTLAASAAAAESDLMLARNSTFTRLGTAPAVSTVDGVAAMFHIYLLTNTQWRPTDVSCAPPPDSDTGVLVCFAFVDDSQSIVALATPRSDGAYEFTPLAKADRPVSPTAVATSPATIAAMAATPATDPSAAEADRTLLAVLAVVLEDPDGLRVFLQDADATITSLDLFAFDPGTATLQLTITSTIADPAGRDFLAFRVTTMLSLLWGMGRELRDPAATIQPRLEVTVNAEIYGTPFDVMTGVADGVVDFAEWLAVSRGASTNRAGGQPVASRAVA